MKRFAAAVTAISLLLPTAIFAFAASAAASPQGSGTASSAAQEPAKSSIRPSIIITLQAQDLIGRINGEIGGIPQFGLTADMGMGGVGERQNLASRLGAMKEARADNRYAATPLSSEAAIGLPDVALVGNAASQVLLKADGQASEAFKLTSPSSLPSLIETPMQALASGGAVTIKNLMDRTPAVAPAVRPASKAVEAEGAHRFGTVLTGMKPTVGAAPFGREWATVVLGSFTAGLVLRLGTAPEGALTSATPSWVAIWLDLLICLAGLAALSRAQRGLSTRCAQMVLLKCEQRE